MHRTISFMLGGMRFEYDEDKEKANIRKHGISFRTAARVFFDEDYIEEYDEFHSDIEPRYSVIGDTSAGFALNNGRTVIGNAIHQEDEENDILYVVYTERLQKEENGKSSPERGSSP